MSKNIFLVFFLLLLNKSLLGQNVPIGQWRVHLPYSFMTGLAITETSVYAVSPTGSFSLDQTDNSINILSRVSGLSDISITAIRYSEKYQTVVIGYEDGNIDLINNDVISNFNDIVRSNVVGSKTINHIHVNGDYAYLSGDFGVSVFNLAKGEIKESYRSLAPGGQNNPVYGSTITDDGDSIFLATSRGVMAAKVSQTVNLLDYNNWRTFTTADNIPVSTIHNVCSLNGTIYASADSIGIYYFNGSSWNITSIPIDSISIVNAMDVSEGKILACVDSAVIVIESPTVYTAITSNDITSPTQALYDAQGVLWISDHGHGLVKYVNGNTSIHVSKGPLTNDVFNFCYRNYEMLVMSGGYDESYAKRYIADGYFTFTKEEDWKFANGYSSPIPPSYRDLVHASYNTINSCTYISTFGYGLIVVTPDNNYLFFDSSNSVLGTLIGSTAIDPSGNIWIVDRATGLGNSNLHVFSKNNAWKNSYTLSGNLAQGVIKITIDDYNNKWITSYLSGKLGLIVFNETGNQERDISSGNNDAAKLPSDQVNCITKDKKGNMWIGTKTGIAICYNPGTIIKGGDLTVPIYNGFPLLYEREIKCITVDGGNRKWVGTDDGVWLFNEDATDVVSYFTTDNSPLLSNYILDIGIHESTGEVFFGTDKGIISYRGTATESAAATGVTVFPNPVKPEFRGFVGISGLATDAVVKITDIYGNLCYQTNAQGGTAVWNVKDYNGNRARSGVYLVFSSSTDGQSTYVAKIAVLE